MKLEYPACFYRDEETGAYAVEFPDLPGCVTGGATLTGAIRMAQDAAKGWIEDYLEEGVPVPVPSPQGDIQPDTGGTVQRVTIDIAQNICISVDPRKDTAKVPSPPLPPNAQPVVSPKMVGAEEYICNRDPEADEYYAMFFRACRKFRVEWAHASDKERAFIEEFVRVEFEKSMARKKGIPESSVRPFFG